MKTVISLHFVMSALLSLSSCATPRATNLVETDLALASMVTPVRMPIAGGILRMSPLSRTVWLVPGIANKRQFRNFVEVSYKEPGVLVRNESHGFTFDLSRSQWLRSGYFPSVGGGAEELTIRSSDPKVLRITQDDEGNHLYEFARPGDVDVVFLLKGDSVVLPIKVVAIPIEKGDTMKEVIKKLGLLPEKEDRFFVDWYESKSVNGIRYAGSAGEPVWGVHWRYREFPNAVLAFRAGKLSEVGTMRQIGFDREVKQIRRSNPEVFGAERKEWLESE